MSKQVNIVLPKPLNDRLDEVTEKTGLNKSEIGRRGILEQINELEGDRSAD